MYFSPLVERTAKSHDERHGYREGQSIGVSNTLYYNGDENFPQNMADQEAERSLMTPSNSLYLVREGKSRFLFG